VVAAMKGHEITKFFLSVSEINKYVLIDRRMGKIN